MNTEESIKTEVYRTFGSRSLKDNLKSDFKGNVHIKIRRPFPILRVRQFKIKSERNA